MNKGIRTAEYVAKGHPDKVCDAISDAILEEYHKQDPDSRVAVETMGGHGIIHIMGEITSKAEVNCNKVAREVYRSVGYKDCVKVIVDIAQQSPEIARGVDNGGAGDQGIMIGYACDENEEYLPQEYYLAKKIIEELPDGFGPDGKSQVTLNSKNEIETIVLSVQSSCSGYLGHMGAEYRLREYLRPYGAKRNIIRLFHKAGFAADTGLTGRKIVVDAYGPQVPVGGGAFSGKDYTKVDRSGAKRAREIAIEMLLKHKAHEVLVKLAYAIGEAKPVMAVAEIDGIQNDISKDYDLTPKGLRS
jgi:S-adenosylmethionine synthetase